MVSYILQNASYSQKWKQKTNETNKKGMFSTTFDDQMKLKYQVVSVWMKYNLHIYKQR